MRTPLTSFDGKRAIDVARQAYLCHQTQQWCSFTVDDYGPYSASKFGLYKTSVGEDVAKNDLFENLTSYDEMERIRLEEEEAKRLEEEEKQRLEEEAKRKAEEEAAQNEETNKTEPKEEKDGLSGIEILIIIAIVLAVLMTGGFAAYFIISSNNKKKRRKKRRRR
jgi:hypothetical protein